MSARIKCSAIMISCLLFVALSCSDRDSENISGDKILGPQLAGTTSIQIIVPDLTKDNFKEFAESMAYEGWDGLVAEYFAGKPTVVTLEKATVWKKGDTVKKGVLYRFNSFKDLKTAYADRPDMMERIIEGSKSISSGDRKLKSGTQLASGSDYAHAFAYRIKGETCIEAYGGTGNESLQGYVTHQNFSQDGNSHWINRFEEYDDHQQHDLSWAHYWYCPDASEVYTFGEVTRQGQSVAYSDAWNSCPGDD